MAANIVGIFDDDLKNAILSSKVLVVGAGGIGCELLKNLVLSGFPDIEIIDLDTIDVSNLNRQFLFHKQHVGSSKAEVAKASALRFNPNVSIKHYHDSIIGTKYDINFFKTFNVVMNALDNRAARSHVNRMCLAAGVPLVESGTAGYDGQVELIKKGLTKCYECEPKAAQKTFPSCTIRNTPSEPIHCIVWAKYLFNQLFGEEDADKDVSPDQEDPEAQQDKKSDEHVSTTNGNVVRKSTRQWAQECNYDPEKIFHKLFRDDINYLLSMSALWTERRPPTPLSLESLPDAVAGSSSNTDNPGLKDLKAWSIAECEGIFRNSLLNLRNDLKKVDDYLVWDKDDKSAMDFVAAAANIRAYIFGIQQKTRFEIKSMAGNIIPAIATTNAIIAGVVVLRAFNVLKQNYKQCQTVYLRLKPNHRRQLLVPEKFLNPPNVKCCVCSEQPEVTVVLDVNKTIVKDLEENLLKKTLHMAAPDALLFSTGDLIISSEEGETEQNEKKTLAEMGIVNGSLLKIDDFLQNYNLNLHIVHKEWEINEPEFQVIADMEQLKPKAEEETNKDDSDDDVTLEEVVEDESLKKRKIDDSKEDLTGTPPKKRIKVLKNLPTCVDDDDDIVIE